MGTSRISGLKVLSRRKVRRNPGTAKGRRRAAFSLVEVVLAVGIVAFAFVAVLALIPTGLSVFHQSLSTSVGSQIAQRVINDAQQTDFSLLIAAGSGGSPFRQVNPLDPAKGYVRWFDDEGKELNSSTGAVYSVNTRIAITTTLPQTNATATVNPDLATITIQVATNPSNLPLAISTTYPDLWSGAYQGNPAVNVVPILTVSALIGKNQ